MTARAAGLALACLGVAALAGCASSPPQPDPVQLRLDDLDTRLTRIERVVQNRSLQDLANQIEAARADLRSVHNSVDEMRHELDQNRKRERDLYADLDTRLKKLEAQSGGDQAAYQAAFDLLKNSKYDPAIGAFKRFLAEYPKSDYADNAQYWLGETYYVNRDFPAALQAFRAVVRDYGQSRKLPDSMLKIGYCEYELQRFAEARRTLREVVAKFPDTPAGRLAAQRLEKMKTEGR